jgi:hypothetical protein
MRANTPPKEGYAKVAELISAYPELAIFRRFGALNMQSLLYQQAELTHLESELRTIAEEDIQAGDSLDHHQDWWTLAHDPSGNARRQWELVQDIQVKLDKYSICGSPSVNTAIWKH